MLVLGRKPGEAIILEAPGIERIIITMLDDGKLGIDAPVEMKIVREELLKDTTA